MTVKINLVDQSLMVDNQYGQFIIRVGCSIACAPFDNIYHRVAAIASHNCLRIVTIFDGNNHYDTRDLNNVVDVRGG